MNVSSRSSGLTEGDFVEFFAKHLAALSEQKQEALLQRLTKLSSIHQEAAADLDPQASTSVSTSVPRTAAASLAPNLLHGQEVLEWARERAHRLSAANAQARGRITEILPNLFLGNKDASADLEALEV